MGEITTAQQVTPEALRTAPATPADAVRRQAQIDAVVDWLSELRDAVRSSLDHDADQMEDMSGGAFNLPVAGVGRALRTDPQPKARISDPVSFANWCADHGWDELATSRKRLDITDTDAAAELWLRAGGENPDGTELAALVRKALTPRTETLISEDAIDELVTGGAVAVTPSGVIDSDGVRVPGTEVSVAPRQLNVRIDDDHKKDLRRQIVTVVGEPTLTEGTDNA